MTKCIIIKNIKEVYKIIKHSENNKTGFSIDEVREKLIKTLVHELPVLRARLGLSQSELADRIGVSRQTLSSIETQKREMTWTTFVALVAIFQNNEQTCKMFSYIENWDEELKASFSVSET